MRVYVGTSGYSYEPWKGTFYPKGLGSSKMLAFYATQFPTVELNATFYRMPTPKLLAGWRDQVPDAFRFSVKAPQRITHQKRLVGCEDTTEAFTGYTRELAGKRGPLLFQLPPNMKKDAPRLEAFLKTLPEDARVAFEFRNAGWYDEEIYALLRGRNAALCTAEGEVENAPFVPTADWGYLRLRLTEYDEGALAAWADRIRATPWGDAYVFLKHEDEGKGPGFAKTLMERLGDLAVLP